MSVRASVGWAAEGTIDAVTAEVLRNALLAISREMKTNLARTAYNTIIYEAEDFTVGIFDEDGNTLSIGLGLPTFIRGLSDTVKQKIAHWGKENIHPGDILLTNDAYVTGSHLNHMTFTLPIFHDGELVAFAATMAHWSDIGGMPFEGVTTDIYSEGIQIPFVKYYREGLVNPELTALIRANVRWPERALGDLRAQLAAIRTGERRLSAILERYGNEAFRETVQLIYRQSERLAREAVRAIPDGVYEADSFLDDDGVNIGQHVPVRVKVRIDGDQMTIDLTGVGAQVAGYFNSGRTAGLSACQVAFKCLTTPTLYPINDGALRPLKVVLPPGRFLSATKPAAMRRWMAYPMTVIDTIFKAIAQAKPEISIAGHHADLAGLVGGGWGAKHDQDGVNGTICINDGDTHFTPAEAIEAKNPVIVTHWAFRTDSGGPGEFRGGLGAVREVEWLIPSALYHGPNQGFGMAGGGLERTICPPWGLFGGKPGMPNRAGQRLKDGRIHYTTGKRRGRPLDTGEAVFIEAGGGGGFGDPLRRDPRRVLNDVRLGYVSDEAAKRDYGVIVRREGRRVHLDLPGTQWLRAELSRAPSPAQGGPS